MALGRVPYTRLEPLLRRYLSTVEDLETRRLCRSLRVARHRGYLTASELRAVCCWKSPRAIRHIAANSAGQVRRATRAALATRDERERLEALRQLKGVSVAMASAVLTLVNPTRYGVIDIRVWQLLHRLGTVETNAQGVNFTAGNWYRFLEVVRHFSERLGVKARDVERTLFHVHKVHQMGQLYRVHRPLLKNELKRMTSA